MFGAAQPTLQSLRGRAGTVQGKGLGIRRPGSSLSSAMNLLCSLE